MHRFGVGDSDAAQASDLVTAAVFLAVLPGFGHPSRFEIMISPSSSTVTPEL
jgi:hypothetical protein